MTLSSILPKVGKFILRTIAVLIGIILAILSYTILRPILRAIGWIISAVTFIAILMWLMTMF